MKVEKETIDGIVFESSPFNAMRALELLGRLAQTVGPALGVLATSDMKNADEMEKMTPVIAQALMGLKPQELSGLALEVLRNTTATIEEDGRMARVDILTDKDFNRVYSGRLLTMFKSVMFALKVNYADFGLGSALKANAPSPAATE
jgi:hypothetical protein